MTATYTATKTMTAEPTIYSDWNTYIRDNNDYFYANGSRTKAWVNFNGTGTVAIRASYNVTSITDGGTGTYTVNFTSAMADANYAVSLICSVTGTNGLKGGAVPGAPGVYTANAVGFVTGRVSDSAAGDMDYVFVIVVR